MSTITPNTMLPVGATLNGRYRIERYLSSGGFGNTYVATNEFGEQVAVKEFFIKGINERDEGSTTVSVSNSENRGKFEQQREKFKKEAMRLRGFNSDHIVKVFSFFEENGTAYYVMNYIDGESLSQRLDRLGGMPMPEAEVRGILDQVLDALDVVHGANPRLLHLDIKPGNIMVDSRGVVQLIDFGASKHIDPTTGGVTTHTEAAFTKGYAPLEQVEGRMDKIGPWTDLYALGATLYRLLTAQQPPQYSDIQEEGPAAFNFPAAVSQQMRDLILWLMQSERNKRPQSVDKVRQRLSGDIDEVTVEALSDKATEETRAGQQGKNPEPKPKSNFLPVVVAIVVASIVGGIWWGVRGSTGSVDQGTASTAVGTGTTVAKTVEKQKFTYALDGTTYTYTGDVDADGAPDGNGEALWPDGRTYKGKYSHGKMHGEGVFEDPKNQYIFSGEMRNDRFYHGKMTYTDDGSYFEGTFQKGDAYDGDFTDANGEKKKVVKGQFEE
ncbi:MAG: protein kinase [Muribaculaceae bacterium]|nr:protein kinase [Muribaculaceae bacterium]